MRDRTLIYDSALIILAGALALILGWGMSSAAAFTILVACVLRPIGRAVAVWLLLGGVTVLSLLFTFGARLSAEQLSNIVYVLFAVLVVELIREVFTKREN